MQVISCNKLFVKLCYEEFETKKGKLKFLCLIPMAVIGFLFSRVQYRKATISPGYGSTLVVLSAMLVRVASATWLAFIMCLRCLWLNCVLLLQQYIISNWVVFEQVEAAIANLVGFGDFLHGV